MIVRTVRSSCVSGWFRTVIRGSPVVIIAGITSFEALVFRGAPDETAATYRVLVSQRFRRHAHNVLMPDPFHALVLMNLLFVVGAWCLARPSYAAAAVLVANSVAWALWNQPIEGRVLVSFSIEHGITESDMLSVLAVVIATVTVYRSRVRSRRSDEEALSSAGDGQLDRR